MGEPLRQSVETKTLSNPLGNAFELFLSSEANRWSRLMRQNLSRSSRTRITAAVSETLRPTRYTVSANDADNSRNTPHRRDAA
jgi:hypothetical protein